MARLAVLLPGMMGSALSDPGTGGVIWSSEMFENYALLRSTPQALAWSGTPANAELIEEFRVAPGPIPAIPFLAVSLWGRVIDMVGSHTDFDQPGSVLRYGYDWRRSLVEQAAQLGTDLATERQAFAIEHGLEPEDIKFTLIGHSMGGLLARIALGQGDLQLGDVDRMIHIGSPLRGAPAAFESIYGNQPGNLPMLGGVVKGFRSKNRASFLRAVSAVLRTFPSAYQLLPPAEQPYLMVNAPASFNPLVEPPGSLIAPEMRTEAEAAHQALQQASLILAGQPEATATVFTADHTERTVFHLRVTGPGAGISTTYDIRESFKVTAGDGSVLAGSAKGEDWIRSLPVVNVRHSTMCNNAAVAMSVRALL